MNYALLAACALCSVAHAFEYEIQFEDERVIVSKVVLEPREEIGFHRDAYPQIVYPVRGGRITRIEADGSLVDVDFPTGKSVYRKADPEDILHKSISRSDEQIELIIVQLR